MAAVHAVAGLYPRLRPLSAALAVGRDPTARTPADCGHEPLPTAALLAVVPPEPAHPPASGLDHGGGGGGYRGLGWQLLWLRELAHPAGLAKLSARAQPERGIAPPGRTFSRP